MTRSPAREYAITVVGSLNLDLVAETPTLPLPGETRLGGPFASYPGGKGANQAVAARRLLGTPRDRRGGAPRVAMLGCVGDDAFAATLREGLARADVVDRTLEVPGASGVALITVAGAAAHGENTIVVVPGANAALTPDHVAAHADLFASSDWVVLQLECPLPTVVAAAEQARAADARVLLNAAPCVEPLPERLLHACDLVVVNRVEALALAAREPSGPWSPTRVDELLDALAVRGATHDVVITLGADGAVARLGDGERIDQPAFAVDVVDTVGAGDAFVAGLAVARVQGADAADAMRFAAAAGALATTRPGAMAAAPSRTEVEALLDRG